MWYACGDDVVVSVLKLFCNVVSGLSACLEMGGFCVRLGQANPTQMKKRPQKITKCFDKLTSL